MIFLNDVETFLIELLHGNIRCAGKDGRVQQALKKNVQVSVREISAIKCHCLCSILQEQAQVLHFQASSCTYILAVCMCLHAYTPAHALGVGLLHVLELNILVYIDFNLYHLTALTCTHVPSISMLSFCLELYSGVS